jgi:23S rRNA pseudouridine2605 synthase
LPAGARATKPRAKAGGAKPPGKKRARGRTRLDRALSKLRLASRSEARALIAGGRVTVGGRRVTNPASEVVPERDDIRVDGRRAPSLRWRTILLNKPRGVVTTRSDPGGRRTVFDILGAEADSLVAVGRLDMATTGLLLLTTDTRLAAQLTDSASAVVRRYVVTVRGRLDAEAASRMEQGYGGMQAKSVTIRKPSARETHLVVELTEGKNREIRRLCEAAGHEVTKLKRIAFGPLELGSLQPGEWREVAREEIAAALPQNLAVRR